MQLRFAEIEAPFDASEAIVHAIETQAHLGHFARHVRDAALDRTQPAALPALLFADLAQLVAHRVEMFDNQLRRFLGHGRYCG